jgi:hypothetical protein
MPMLPLPRYRALLVPLFMCRTMTTAAPVLDAM